MHANIETCLVIRVADTGIQLSYFTTFFAQKDWILASRARMTSTFEFQLCKKSIHLKLV
ncbi:hypothetical protein [Wolbachia pipientis]|uniref:hypothetical protein n=1 Tax=Wolbachia TaxID=953 RepID=UPI0038B5DEC2